MAQWWPIIEEIWKQIQHGQLPDLGVWSYGILTLLVATEGPLSTLIGAAAAAAGLLDVRWVFVAAATGNILGDTLWYLVGYRGKLNTVYRYARWVGIHRRHLVRLQREMHTHAVKMILLAKVAYGLIVPTLVAAGLARVPWRRWFPVVLVMETLWTALLVWIGFHATGFIVQLERSLRTLGMVVASLIALVALAWYLRHKAQEAQERAAGPEEDDALTFPLTEESSAILPTDADALPSAPSQNGTPKQETQDQLLEKL